MSLFTAPQQTEVEKAVTRTVYFLEFHFGGGIARISTYDRDYVWGEFTWYGLGDIITIGDMEETEGTTPRPLRVNLGAKASWISIAVGPVEDYRGKPAKMYCCPLDENYLLKGTPVLAWNGVMDIVTLTVDGENGAVDIKCETSAFALKRSAVFRVNAAQHKSRYPTETGLDYQADLIANPKVWLSRRFMSR